MGVLSTAGAGLAVRAYRAADREALIDRLVEMERHYDADTASPPNSNREDSHA
ncbi:MAG: hypothetical protein AAF416_14050 [Pseudomonadota bacterium]